MEHKSNTNTSWQHVSKWYKNLVQKEGHYFHRKIIIPKILGLLKLKPTSKVLDLACGNGILGRNVDKDIEYLGVDISKSLIDFARIYDKSLKHKYILSDITKPIPNIKEKYTHAVVVLAIQNIENPERVFNNLSQYLESNGVLIMVINHPCYRIPRQSFWEIDYKNKIQYRRINRYLTTLKIPIKQAPSKENKSPIIWTFHYSIENYSKFFYASGFYIEKIEEWVSDKVSQGKASRMENFSRNEFPLFMTFVLRKKPIIG